MTRITRFVLLYYTDTAQIFRSHWSFILKLLATHTTQVTICWRLVDFSHSA